MSEPNFLDPVFDDDEHTPGFAHRRARLGRQTGAEHLGASLYELGPGIALCPYHWHAAEEEVLIVLSGGPSLRTPEGWRELDAGEVVAFLPGEGGAHQIANWGEETARVLMLSEHKPIEVCGYPDSGKVMADAPDPPISHLWRMDDAVDYFEGEGPPNRP